MTSATLARTRGHVLWPALTQHGAAGGAEPASVQTVAGGSSAERSADGGHPRDLRPLRRARAGQPGDRRASDDARAVPARLEQRRCATTTPSSSASATPGTWRRCTIRPPRARGRQGVHRSVRVSRHPLHLPGGVGAGARGGRAVRRDGQASVRRARVGGRLRRQPRAARLPLRPGRRRQPERRGRAHAQGHNQAHEADKTWSYGPAYRTGVCAAGSHKSRTCDGGGWSLCGSNTYPTGAFPTATVRLASTTSTATPPST